MTDKKVFKIIVDEKTSGREPILVRDARRLAEAVNQHADLIEKLMQRVEDLEKSIEELRRKED